MTRPSRLPLPAAVPAVAMLLVAALCPAAMARPPRPGFEKASLRVKVEAVEPEQPVAITVQWGGRGLGGATASVPLVLVEPKQPRPPDVEGNDLADAIELPADLQDDPAAVATVRDKKTDKVFLKPGFWSRANPLSALTAGFVEFVAAGMQAPVTRLQLAIEFTVDGKVVKTLSDRAEAGDRITILVGDGDPARPDWVAATMDLASHVDARARFLESLPWANAPFPKRLTILTDCSGYGTGFGGRHTSHKVLGAEARALRQLGVNALRGGSDELTPFMRKIPDAASFGRAIETHADLPVVVPLRIDPQSRKVLAVPPGGGCPWYPPSRAEAPARARDTLVRLLERYPDHGEIWALTRDEIGSIFDATPEGKPHMSACPDCQAAFRRWLESLGFAPADFDCRSWDEVRNIAYPDARSWAVVDAEQKRAKLAELEKLPGFKPGTETMTSLEPDVPGGEIELDEADSDPAAKPDTAPKDTAPKPTAATVKPAADADVRRAVADAAVDLSDEDAKKAGDDHTKADEPLTAAAVTPGRTLLASWSHWFHSYTTGHMYAEFRKAIDAHNAAKQAALDAGDTANPVARQPFVYSFALRGNTFLLGDHSLDFFNFYREADNAMVYETSNRDPRVWQWDSYLCDVGRSLQIHMGKRFGVYVKPHRGAAVQRTLAAIARGARMIFLYTYGADYAKGDSFSSSQTHLANCSKAMALVGRAEDWIADARFARPPEVAVVRDGTPNSAEWEDGKWIYTALQHSHVQVDALDQVMLATNDLSRYKAIYVTGGHVRREAAVALRRYVEAGGVLFTGAGGLAHDFSGRPIPEMEEVLGVDGRRPVEAWGGPIRRYGASGLATFGAAPVHPAGHERIDSPWGEIVPRTGHEPLTPREGTEVVARFADGSPALLSHPFGKGRAYLSAIYAGLDYAAKVHRPDFDMNADFPPAGRAFVGAPLAGRVAPAVDVSAPLVEAVPLVQEATGKRSVILINWAHAPDRTVVPQDRLVVTIADGKDVSQVVSLWSGKPLEIERKGDAVLVSIPRLEEGDVLAIE